jgi:hypothetical protein
VSREVVIRRASVTGWCGNDFAHKTSRAEVHDAPPISNKKLSKRKQRGQPIIDPRPTTRRITRSQAKHCDHLM